MTGVCLDRITTMFPQYPIASKVEKDVIDAYENEGGIAEDLQKLPKSVGSDTDFMIGINYLKYHPKAVERWKRSHRWTYEEVFTTIENYFNLNSNH